MTVAATWDSASRQAQKKRAISALSGLTESPPRLWPRRLLFFFLRISLLFEHKTVSLLLWITAPVSLAMTSLFASRGALAFMPSIARSTRPGTVRTFTTTPSKPSSDDGDNKAPFAFPRGPAPPRLPKEEQEIFEELQRKSTGAFTTPKVNQSPASEDAKSQGTLHPDAVMGVKPEFEGDQNPKTGEVGGPKNEPLRWGADGDWSYGGRVTDF